MKFVFLLFASLISLMPAIATPASIFDGRTLGGWVADAAGGWRVEAGSLTPVDGPNSAPGNLNSLTWREPVHDFVLSFASRVDVAADADAAHCGVIFRASEVGGHDGYRIWVQGPSAGRIESAGGAVVLAARGQRVSLAPDGRRWIEPILEPVARSAGGGPGVGEWQPFRIVARGPHLELWSGEELCSVLEDHRDGAARYSGVLAFFVAAESGPRVALRDVRLEHLGRTDAPPAATAVGTGRAQESPVLWHLRPNPVSIQKANAQPATDLVADMKLVHGFRADLVAAEPHVRQPIAFAIDARGRLWVAEAFSYPTRQPEGQGKDRIVIFADEDGDGEFESRKVFAEGLNLVSGLEVGFGGVWVGAAPELLFIPDRDGDDRADGPPEVRLDGWGFQDTHETLNSFTWGPDGWLYGNQGVFTKSAVGPPGTPDAQRTEFRAAVWRYHPVREVFEIFSHGGSNQWGIDFNQHGHLFLTHCRSFHGGGGTTYAIRNGHFWNQTNSGYPPFISNTAPDFAPELKNLLPASARYDSGEGGAGRPGTTAVYGGHSHVGTLIYLGDNWPGIYRDHLFTHNLHGHQLNHQVNVRQGSAYETLHGGYDLLYAPDPTYVAVDLQTGPDGAVYVIDWSDRQHCHSPHEERWDRSNGRIFRIVWADTYRPARVNLAAGGDLELVALHAQRNEWHVRTARRLLQERAAVRPLDPQAVAQLRKMAGTAADATGALRAYWTLHVTGHADAGVIAAMLAHPADVVRAWGVQLGTEQADAFKLEPAELARLASTDPSAMVRLAVASTLPLLAPEARWAAGRALALRAEDAGDRFLPRMVWFGLADLAGDEIPEMTRLAATTPLPTLADSIHWFIARWPHGRDELVARMAALPLEAAERQLRLLAFSLEGESNLPMPAGWTGVASRFSARSGTEIATLAERLAAVFGDRAVLRRMRDHISDTSLPVAVRQRALEVLKQVGDREALPRYVPLLREAAFRATVIPLLAGTDDPAAAEALLELVPNLPDAERAAALQTLTRRPSHALALLAAVQQNRVDPRRITALHVRQMRNLDDPQVDARLDAVWGRAGESSEAARATIARLKQAYAAAPLWAYSAQAGRETYVRLCAACHVRDGEGGTLGPDLTGSWQNGVDYFLENIIDPNAVVGAGFQLHVITRRDGTVLSGMIEKQTDSQLVLRTAAETVHVPLAEITGRQTLPQSIMPPGLLESISERETIELLKFLTSRR